MLQVRKQYRSFGWGGLEWLDWNNDRIAAYRRHFKEESILVIHSLSGSKERLRDAGETTALRDLLTGKLFDMKKQTLIIELDPCEYLWLKSDRGAISSS